MFVTKQNALKATQASDTLALDLACENDPDVRGFINMLNSNLGRYGNVTGPIPLEVCQVLELNVLVRCLSRQGWNVSFDFGSNPPEITCT